MARDMFRQTEELIDLRNKVTVRQAAQLTGRHQETVKRWIREERLPAQMVGQMWYIDLLDLEKVSSILELKRGIEAFKAGQMVSWNEVKEELN